MIQRRDALSSEIRELEQMLDGIPSTAVIQRISLESRLKSAREALEQELACCRPSHARLTFRGKPVVGNHGISADFGGKASSAFADAFAAVVAGLNESLQFMGPIPDRAKNQLLITGTSTGSFGFEFELPAAGLFPDQEKTGDALQKMVSLLEASASGSDDDVAELVDAIHPRAVKKISEFLGLLAQNQAWCGLEFRGKRFRFDGFEQLGRSASRLLAKTTSKSTEKSIKANLSECCPTAEPLNFRHPTGLSRERLVPLLKTPI